MRSFEERKAEIFLRSYKRIKDRQRAFSRVVAACIPICIITIGLMVAMLPGDPAGNDSVGSTLGGATGSDGSTGNTDVGETLDPGDADLDGKDNIDVGKSYGSFSITWNVYGISSYDSATGKLVKTTDATNPEDYVTILYLTDSQLGAIWDLILDLDIKTYPDEYDPQEGKMSSEPSMTLILTVKTADFEKTVRAEHIAILYESDSPKGQRFLAVCKGIVEILTSTEEWKLLPDYETLYE